MVIDMCKFKFLKFCKSRSSAENEAKELLNKGVIINYKVSWNTQLKCTLEVVYKMERKTHSSL